MERRRVLAAAGGGLLTAAVSWLAVEPVEWCLLLPSLPPQGACQSRLGTITPLGGGSATPFAILTGAAAAGLIWMVALGPGWRRLAVVAGVVALAIAVPTMPIACEWVLPAGRMPHVDELVRNCTNLAGVATPVTRPQDAAVWSITAGIVAVGVAWLLGPRAPGRTHDAGVR